MSAGISGLIANTVELLVNAVSVFKVNGDGAIGVNDSYGEVGQVLKSGGDAASAEFGSAINSSAVVTASGTAIDFTGIPSWAKRVTVTAVGLSGSGTSRIILQLGTSGGVETTGYIGTFFVAPSASAFPPNGAPFGGTEASTVVSSSFILTKHSGNTWSISGVVGATNAPVLLIVGGSKGLSSDLGRVRVTTVGGTDTFDGGTVNVMWE